MKSESYGRVGFIYFLKTEELLCNRKGLQQLVTRSAGIVRAVWGAIGKAFQLEYAVKEYFFEDIRTKEQKDKASHDEAVLEINRFPIMSNTNLRECENCFLKTEGQKNKRAFLLLRYVRR